MVRSSFKILINLVCLLIFFLSSCNIPRDIHGTFDRVSKEKVLRVGYSNNPPFIQIKENDTTGIEYRIVDAFSKEMGYKVEYTEGTEAVLMEKLEKYEIDIIIAGLNNKSPWKSKAGFTQPYATVNGKDYSLAVPPGENAFLVFVEQFLNRNKDQINIWVDEQK